MSTGVWAAICVTVAVLASLVVFLLTSWGFLQKDRKLPELPPTAQTFLPASRISAADVEGLRFHTERRGYDRAEVDWALAQIANDLEARALLENNGSATVTGDVHQATREALSKPPTSH